MRVEGAVVVVTGAGSGIGAALARRFAADGAQHVVVVDRNDEAARVVADEIGGTAEVVDVTDRAAVEALVARTIDTHERIDLFCSNAGVATGIGVEDDDTGDLWHSAYEVNVLAHVHAARAVLPSMLARGSGHLLNTASAAGLLISPDDAPYTASKHAAVGLAKWLAVTYGARGIGVGVICPLGVDTPLLMGPLADGDAGARAVAASGEIISPEQVADAVAEGLAEDRFLILPHPQVGKFWSQQAGDPQRWLAGMQRAFDPQSHDREETSP